MLNLLITHLQIFGIGFTFGIAGPCFLVCTPVLLTYVVGSKRKWTDVFKDVLTFLAGRLIAYLMLGFFAGLSGAILRKFTSSNFSLFFRPLAGAVTILFAILVLLNKENQECACPSQHTRIFNFGGVFIFGFLIGLSPCAPLLALLFDITLISKNALDGMFYALSFGIGTFLSGLITIGIIAGLLTRVPAALIKSKSANIIFKVICAVLLFVLGLSLIFR